MAVSGSQGRTVLDPSNSTTTPLIAFGIFTGQYTDTLGFGSISLSVNSDVGAQFPGISVEWSADGVVTHQRQLFSYGGQFFDGAGQSDGLTFHFPIRQRYYRVTYSNDFQPQTFFVMTALLKESSSGGTVQSIAPSQVFSTLTIEGQTTLSILAAQDYFNSQFVLPNARTDGVPIGSAYLCVDQPVAVDFTENVVTPASLTSVTIDRGFGESGRRWASVYNDTIRGTLFLGLGISPTLVNYHWKVPPRHTWNLPQAWTLSSSQLNGIWDIADGSAFYTEGDR